MSSEKKIILVTGASSGIGNSTATILAKRGYKVYGTSRDPSSCTRKADEFFELIEMDSTQDASVDAAVSGILARHGSVDVIICCAGMAIAGSVEETSMGEIAMQMDTNFMGTVRVIKYLLPHFRKESQGRVIVVSSIAGIIGLPFQAFYSASKFALEGFVEGLRMEMKPFGIEACLVEPGDHHTGLTASRKMVNSYKANSAVSPYSGRHEAAIGQQIRDETGGHDPLEVARLIEKLISAKHLSVRYTAGPVFQRFSAKAKPFIPSRIFEKIIRSLYNV